MTGGGQASTEKPRAGAEPEPVPPLRPFAPAHRRRFALAVVALMLCATPLVTFRIGRDSFWFDEAASIRHVRDTDWPHLLGVAHSNMVLYLALLKLWLPHAHSEATIRMLSAISFVLTIPVVAILGRRLRNTATGLLAAAIVATQPFLVRYGQEARAFTLVTLLITGGALGLVAGVQDANRTKLLVGIGLLALAPYAHAVSGLAGVALVAWVLYLPPSARPVRWKCVAGLYAALVAPFVVLFLRGRSDSQFWTRKDFLRSVPATAWHVTSDTPAVVVVAGFAVIGAVFAVAAMRREGRTITAWATGVPLIWVGATSALVFAVSLRQSLIVPRYLLLIVPGIALLVASAATQVPWSRAACAFVVVAALTNATFVVARGGEYRHERWRDAERYVARQARAGDGIVFAPTHKSVAFEYYETAHDGGAPDPLLPSGVWGALRFSGDRLHHDQPSDIDTALDAITEHRRIWVVTSWGAPGGPAPAYRRHLAEILEAYGDLAETRDFGKVTVARYDTRR